MVATDGHRLAQAERSIGPDVEGLASGVIVPRKGLTEVKRLVDEEEADEVEIGFAGNSGLVRRGGVTLVMRLIEGEFPDYRKVIPQGFNRFLTLPSEVLIHALRRVAVLSSERSRAVKLELSDGRLVVSSNNPDLGEAQEELDVDYGGEPAHPRIQRPLPPRRRGGPRREGDPLRAARRQLPGTAPADRRRRTPSPS